MGLGDHGISVTPHSARHIGGAQKVFWNEGRNRGVSDLLNVDSMNSDCKWSWLDGKRQPGHRGERGVWGRGCLRYRALLGVGVERDRKGWLTFNALDHPKILSNCETL